MTPVRHQPKPAKLTEAQVRAAWRLYQAGHSLHDLAHRGWKAWGYASQASARGALRRQFRKRHFRVRDIGAACRVRIGRCAGCGVPYPERTRGCGPCRARHSRRRVRSHDESR
jgi:hypothetical protein